MKFFGKHSVLAAQTNSLWYKRASCVSPIEIVMVLSVMQYYLIPFLSNRFVVAQFIAPGVFEVDLVS